MIAFDVSNSMLASSTDRPDGVSRLDRAKLLLEKLVDRLDDDKVGLVVLPALRRCSCLSPPTSTLQNVP